MEFAERLRNGWPLPTRPDLREELLAAYAHPERGYHDTRHLDEVLTRIDALAELAELSESTEFDALAVRLAAWFHDGVYDGQPGAEERSAQWAEDALAEVLPTDVVGEVARLVRLTEHHRPEIGDTNGAVLCDADLAILASGPERYADYVDTVRREYADVPEEVFSAGRARILQALLDNPTLFHTAYAIENWEATARTNVRAELTHLPHLTPR